MVVGPMAGPWTLRGNRRSLIVIYLYGARCAVGRSGAQRAVE
jgi:hypothetical protein